MDINRIISGLTSSGVLGGLAGGAVSGAIMGNKKARKTAGTALKVGGVAALGAVAWKAYSEYRAKAGTEPEMKTAASADDNGWNRLSQNGFEIDPADDRPESKGVLIIQAMIAAASSDGHLDDGERRRIMDRVAELELAPDEKAVVFDALHKPLSLSELTNRVDSPELGIEVYLSSMLAVERSRAEAQHYLDALAFRLGLPADLTERLASELEASSVSAVA